jgi:hypothetical protein
MALCTLLMGVGFMNTLIISTPFALGIGVNISVFTALVPRNEKCLHFFLVIERLNDRNSAALSKGIIKRSNSPPMDLTAFRARSVLGVESFTFDSHVSSLDNH